MRVLFVLLSCAACNSLLGLDTTKELPPADAPHYACDPLPAFRTQPVKLAPALAQYTADLHDDTMATGWDTGAAQIVERAGSSTFGPAMIMDPANATNEVPRLSPSGEELFVRSTTPTGQGTAFRYFVRGSSSWTTPNAFALDGGTLNPILVTPTDVISTPSQGATQRRIVLEHHGTRGTQLVEFYEASAVTWKLVDRPIEPPDLGVDDFSDPYLSPDANALMFVGVSGGARDVYIVLRGATGTFTGEKATKLYVAPPGFEIHAPFLKATCERLYFTNTDGVYYVTP